MLDSCEGYWMMGEGATYVPRIFDTIPRDFTFPEYLTDSTRVLRSENKPPPHELSSCSVLQRGRIIFRTWVVLSAITQSKI